jgi:hypothetical protein
MVLPLLGALQVQLLYFCGSRVSGTEGDYVLLD